ncbi:TetR/AcrR family transcriptional regulator [Nocardia farcinica]|uniref:TetR/AcrR family transcriptional regulator n=1 Tax=Nocardia farcinica TaxID=37329 RepID=UPI0018938460|nr:TetR family transcriptional regulator C-terminal domain-containing protein [Nocardia farcinica]MBF6573546.1 TetR family transcriptional regulator C-terminal domain-containing protein [Nocardia farcinica]
MPKTIDQEQRRAEIAAAVWRLIDQSGMSAVSLRTVAAEAGLVLGSLRHTFPTKADLLAYAMELVFVRAEQRVSAHAAIGDPRRRALAMLLELLPLDEQRRIEMRVDLALVAEAPAHPRLAVLAGRAHTAVAALCHDLCADLAAHGLLHTARAVAAEARRLHALVDGTALHLLVAPEEAATAETLIADYLADLGAPPPRRR